MGELVLAAVLLLAGAPDPCDPFARVADPLRCEMGKAGWPLDEDEDGLLDKDDWDADGDGTLNDADLFPLESDDE